MASCSLNLLWLCTCFCGLSSTNSGRPVVTSIVRMSRLAQFEQTLVSFVREKVSQFPLQFVNFASSVEEEYARAYDYPLSFIDFPVNQYRLIRRFSFDWPRWLEQLRTPECFDRARKSLASSSQFLEFYKQQSKLHNETDKFDPKFDLPIASVSIARLHILYRNKTGLLPNEDTTGCPPLSETELLELCAMSFHDTEAVIDINYTFHWITLFINRMKKYLPYSSGMYMVDYVLKHRDIYGRPNYHNSILEVKRKKMERLIRLIEKYPQSLQKYFDFHDRSLETQVCRSFGDRSEHGNYCFMFHSPRAPYAPFKYEILHTYPYVVVVRNFMPLQMTRSIISTALKEGSAINRVIYKHSLIDGQPVTAVKADIRLSESTVFDHYHPVNAWLDLRVEHATLLQPHSQPMPHGVRDGEKNHILHYGLSGHYIAHHDFFKSDIFIKKKGNRLATVLVYLTDVHSGGHTAFPFLNVSFTPRAGNALVWYNLDPFNGDYLDDSLHVACPVNIGRKWVINRWIKTHRKIG